MIKNNKLVDESDENESMFIDCQLVEFLKDEILSQSTNVPREFIMRVVMLLNRGSVLSTCTTARGMCILTSNWNFKENKWRFEVSNLAGTYKHFMKTVLCRGDRLRWVV